MKSKLPSSVLRRIWALSDIDQDGQLDRDEFAVSLFLIDHKLQGNDLPDKLPDRLVPPSKRGLLRRQRGGAGGGGGGMGSSATSSGYSGGFSACFVCVNTFTLLLPPPIPCIPWDGQYP